MQAAALVARVRSADAPRVARERQSQVADVHVTGDGWALGGGRWAVGGGRWAGLSRETWLTDLSGGERQGSCRAHQDAASALVAEGSGLSTTVATGVQFRILLDQRPGSRRRARS
jgi:hypothetical protein